MPHRDGDDPRNVLLNEMNQPFADYALDGEAMARWEEIIKLRNTVNAALEQARNEKKIGKSLEAKVVIALPEFDETGLEEMDVEYLADILIVSQADRMKSDITEVRVDVAPAQGQKCERCWKVLPTVGQDSKHPTLCPRCARVVPAIEVE